MSSNKWDSFFNNWPKSLARQGVLQSVLDEAMPFKNYWIKDGMLLIERVTPDAMGVRFVLLSFEAINLVKFTAPLSADDISEAGFQAKAVSGQPQLV